MNWSNIFENIHLWYNEFIEWYFMQPIYVQILSIVGIISLLSLIIILIYYLIKGIAYLVYYLLKGIYYLLKGIGYGFFKLCNGFYNLISGKSNAKTQTENKFKSFEDSNRTTIIYCTKCGKPFSEKMIMKFNYDGVVFCEKCGNKIKFLETARAPMTTK
ncbi:MAG: hypothetical protein ACFFHD_13945 [Promethearchaeota archaeon]